MRGFFNIGGIVVPNTFLADGEQALLKMFLRADNTIVAGGGNFYIGLCGDAFSQSTTLSTLAGEPSATNGYARQAIARNSTGWPTVDLVNGTGHARSAVCNFTATGGDFSTTIVRAFLCSAASGTSGTLFSVSAPMPVPFLVTQGVTLPVQYDLWMD